MVAPNMPKHSLVNRAKSSVTIDIDAFEIGEMELAHGALLENIQSRLAFRSEAERLRHHQGIDADELVHVAFDGFDAFNLEAEMLEPRRLRILAHQVLHLPRQDEDGDAAIAETVVAVAAFVGDRKLVDGGVELGATLRSGGVQRDMTDVAL